MSLETAIVAAADTIIAAGQVYADTHPVGVSFTTPFMIFQQVGGRPSNTFCGNTDKQNAIVQFSIWGDDSQMVRDLMRAFEKLLTSAPIHATSMGSAITRPGPETRTFGAQQDFSLWFIP